jgi:putative ABC transport system permease protein
MFKDYFTIPWKEMRRRRVRSWLTLIGVFIGIAAIVSLVTLGEGLENAITEQFEALGKDKLFITAKGNVLTAGLSTEAIVITVKDAEVIKKTSGVKQAAGMIYTSARVEFNEVVRYPFIWGMSTDPEERALIGEAQSFTVGEGRSLRDGDRFKAVLGWENSKKARFGKIIELDDKILINNKEFEVVGFLEKIGSPPDDQSIMIPLETYWELIGDDEEYGILVAQTNSGEDPNIVAGNIKKELRKHRNLQEGKEDFTIQTPDQFAESFAVILDIVQIVLIGIAGISLLVGGIGIMNTMYTSVLQRTKEIGVLKALGARNSHIMYLFLVESGLYGLGGGILGTVLGLGFAKIVEAAMVAFVGPAFLSIQINWMLVVGTLLFSFIVGCLSGIAPARQASKMKPVDSLRYE